MSEEDQLVKMANQIAENFSFHEDPAAMLADHLRRFWAPSMRQKLVRLAAEGEQRMAPAVKEIINRIDDA